jgi:hypothetical protein
MKKPYVTCPACHNVRHRASDGEWVSICGIILRDELAGKETYPNFEIVPIHCLDYTTCMVWRDEKEKGWQNKLRRGEYSSVEQMEQIRVNV